MLIIFNCCSNSGAVTGAEVAQLYLSYPSAAAEPPRQLRGFNKIPRLSPAASAKVVFHLTSRDMSIWDEVLRPVHLLHFVRHRNNFEFVKLT